MTNVLLYYLIVINVVTFLVYGIDKWKAKQSKWRISEATLLLLAIIGGSVGAWLGMKTWHHKTMHKKFKYGLPLILLAQIALIALTSCKTKQAVEVSAPMKSHKYEPEHSPNVFLDFNSALAAIKEGTTDSLKAIKDDIAELSKYYGSELWKMDIAADETGKLPPDLKRGVLSEDGIWNLLADYHETQKKIKKLYNQPLY